MGAVAVSTDTQQAEARRQRAEAGEFSYYVALGDIYCTNLGTEKTYRVTAGGECSCPDHVYRKVTCKHVLGLRLHLLNTGGVV